MISYAIVILTGWKVLTVFLILSISTWSSQTDLFKNFCTSWNICAFSPSHLCTNESRSQFCLCNLRFCDWISFVCLNNELMHGGQCHSTVSQSTSVKKPWRSMRVPNITSKEWKRKRYTMKLTHICNKTNTSSMIPIITMITTYHKPVEINDKLSLILWMRMKKPQFCIQAKPKCNLYNLLSLLIWLFTDTVQFLWHSYD